MRGTQRFTNRALSAPVLLLGGERILVLISGLFWAWAFMGVMPHWPMLIVFLGFVVTLFVLRFAAKRDPQGVAVFRRNSRFLLQQRYFLAKGYVIETTKAKLVTTVPTRLLAKL